VNLTAPLHLVPWSRMHESIPPLPQYAFTTWCLFKVQGQLYLYLYLIPILYFITLLPSRRELNAHIWNMHKAHKHALRLCMAAEGSTTLKHVAQTHFTDGTAIDSLRGLGIFLFTTASRTALGPTQPPIQWVPGVLSLGLKRPGREADHSPPSSAEVKE
jgi:hypothetical protein